ncbi:MAG: rod shape determination protein [Proteobacteria bacterium]|nr:rod shape determination protein [Pseudomonadota bacterium]
MFVLGLDIGYSNLKLAMGVSGSPPKVSLHPAGAAPVDRLPESLGKSDEVMRVTVGDSLWATGVNPGRFSLWNRALHQDYSRSDSYRALFHAALLLSGRDTVDLVVTGLPVSQWLDRARRDEIAQRLTGCHRVTPKRDVRVAEVKVIPQPIGGYLDVLWSGTNGVVLEEGRVLVIDPGFFSVDWVVIEAGDLRKTSSGTSLEAMSVLLDHASRLIADEHGGKVPVDRLEEALRTGRGQVLLFGQAIDIAPYVRQAAAKVAPVALEALRESIRSESGSVDAVILTGGGADCYGPMAKTLFPSCLTIIPDQPQLANARGFYYFGGE